MEVRQLRARRRRRTSSTWSTRVDIWTQITCPVLLLRGTESWASDPEIDGRAEAFSDYTFFNIEKAGHWVHHDQLAMFLKLVREFLGA